MADDNMDAMENELDFASEFISEQYASMEKEGLGAASAEQTVLDSKTGENVQTEVKAEEKEPVEEQTEPKEEKLTDVAGAPLEGQAELPLEQGEMVAEADPHTPTAVETEIQNLDEEIRNIEEGTDAPAYETEQTEELASDGNQASSSRFLSIDFILDSLLKMIDKGDIKLSPEHVDSLIQIAIDVSTGELSEKSADNIGKFAEQFVDKLINSELLGKEAGDKGAEGKENEGKEGANLLDAALNIAATAEQFENGNFEGLTEDQQRDYILNLTGRSNKNGSQNKEETKNKQLEMGSLIEGLAGQSQEMGELGAVAEGVADVSKVAGDVSQSPEMEVLGVVAGQVAKSVEQATHTLKNEKTPEKTEQQNVETVAEQPMLATNETKQPKKQSDTEQLETSESYILDSLYKLAEDGKIDISAEQKNMLIQTAIDINTGRLAKGEKGKKGNYAEQFINQIINKNIFKDNKNKGKLETMALDLGIAAEKVENGNFAELTKEQKRDFMLGITGRSGGNKPKKDKKESSKTNTQDKSQMPIKRSRDGMTA